MNHRKRNVVTKLNAVVTGIIIGTLLTVAAARADDLFSAPTTNWIDYELYPQFDSLSEPSVFRAQNRDVGSAQFDRVILANCERICCAGDEFTKNNGADEFLREIDSGFQGLFEVQGKWQPFASFEIKPGTNRVLGNGVLMVPLRQTENSLLFADVRGVFDDNETYEGNWGIGYRRMFDEWIVGAYVFYDRRHSAFNNNFDQLTFGAEALSVDWEFRVNGYIPEDTPKPAAGGAVAAISGSNLVVRAGVERSYYGIDAEIGLLLCTWGECDNAELRGYIGGFHFDNDAPGYPNVSGPRARLEYRIYDLEALGVGSRVTIGAEIQQDQVRDTQCFAMLRVQIPLGRKHRSFYHTGRHRLHRRMSDLIVRDVDVVSTAAATGAEENALINGQAVSNVVTVDGNTADPEAVIEGAGNNSLTIVDGSNGTVNEGDTISLNTGQTVLGGSQALQVTTASGLTGMALPLWA
jgi:hypothetical protein